MANITAQDVYTRLEYILHNNDPSHPLNARDPLLIAPKFFENNNQNNNSSNNNDFFKNLNSCKKLLTTIREYDSFAIFNHKLTAATLPKYNCNLENYLFATKGRMPIDFTTMAEKIRATIKVKHELEEEEEEEGKNRFLVLCEGKIYFSVAEFTVDLISVAINALNFNPPTNPVHRNATELAYALFTLHLPCLRKAISLPESLQICYNCGLKNNFSTENNPLLQCNYCGLWKHTKCEGVANNLSTEWQCKDCETIFGNKRYKTVQERSNNNPAAVIKQSPNQTINKPIPMDLTDSSLSSSSSSSTPNSADKLQNSSITNSGRQLRQRKNSTDSIISLPENTQTNKTNSSPTIRSIPVTQNNNSIKNNNNNNNNNNTSNIKSNAIVKRSDSLPQPTTAVNNSSNNNSKNLISTPPQASKSIVSTNTSPNNIANNSNNNNNNTRQPNSAARNITPIQTANNNIPNNNNNKKERAKSADNPNNNANNNNNNNNNAIGFRSPRAQSSSISTLNNDDIPLSEMSREMGELSSQLLRMQRNWNNYIANRQCNYEREQEEKQLLERRKEEIQLFRQVILHSENLEKKTQAESEANYKKIIIELNNTIGKQQEKFQNYSNEKQVQTEALNNKILELEAGIKTLKEQFFNKKQEFLNERIIRNQYAEQAKQLKTQVSGLTEKLVEYETLKITKLQDILQMEHMPNYLNEQKNANNNNNQHSSNNNSNNSNNNNNSNSNNNSNGIISASSSSSVISSDPIIPPQTIETSTDPQQIINHLIEYTTKLNTVIELHETRVRQFISQHPQFEHRAARALFHPQYDNYCVQKSNSPIPTPITSPAALLVNSHPLVLNSAAATLRAHSQSKRQKTNSADDLKQSGGGNNNNNITETTTTATTSSASRHREYERGNDTMDVWFDSGSSWYSVVQTQLKIDKFAAADVYLEGSDQHRGWFQSSLLTSVAVTWKAPYKTLLTHGFVLDENMRKMSKSLGNVISPNVLINGIQNSNNNNPTTATHSNSQMNKPAPLSKRALKRLENGTQTNNSATPNPIYPVDVLRLWVSSTDYTSDVTIGPSILAKVSEIYRKFRGSIKFLLGNLSDFHSENLIEYQDLPLLEKYFLHELQCYNEAITSSYSLYNFSSVYSNLIQFNANQLSSFYFDISKDSLYTEAANSKQRRAIQTVLCYILICLTKSIAPIMPHTAEQIYQSCSTDLKQLFRSAVNNQSNQNNNNNNSKLDSLFLCGWMPLNSIQWFNPELAKQFSIIRSMKLNLNQMLESLRVAKLIGSNLDINCSLYLLNNTPLAADCSHLTAQHFNIIFITSNTTIHYVDQLPLSNNNNNSNNTSITQQFSSESIPTTTDLKTAMNNYAIRVEIASKEKDYVKCPRCWKYNKSTHAKCLCNRCMEVMKNIQKTQ